MQKIPKFNRQKSKKSLRNSLGKTKKKITFPQNAKIGNHKKKHATGKKN
jgi:hypothetical protein